MASARRSGYSAGEAVWGLASRFRESLGRGNSSVVTMGRDRMEDYAIGLEKASRIIAQAPAMYEALEELRRRVREQDVEHGMEDVLANADAVLSVANPETES